MSKKIVNKSNYLQTFFRHSYDIPGYKRIIFETVSNKKKNLLSRLDWLSYVIDV